MLECIMHHVFLYSDSFLYWCLAYIREGISDLCIYVVVTSPYPPDQGIIEKKEKNVISFMILDYFYTTWKLSQIPLNPSPISYILYLESSNVNNFIYGYDSLLTWTWESSILGWPEYDPEKKFVEILNQWYSGALISLNL